MENSEISIQEYQPEKKKLPPSYQFRALSRKNISLQSRQKCTNCCQVSVPLVLVLLSGLIQVLFNYYVIDGMFNSGAQLMTSPSLVTYSDGSDGLSPTYRWQYYALWHSESQWTPTIGNLTQDGTKAGMLGEINQVINTTDTILSYTPWYAFIQNEETMISQLETEKNYWAESQLANGQIPHCYTCPEAANIFNNVSIAASTSDASILDYQILIDTQMGYDPLKLFHVMMNLLDTAFIRDITNDHSWQVITWSQPLPYIEQAAAFDIGSFLGAIMYPFAVSFVMAVYVNAIVSEKQERLREMMRMMGLRMRWYWLTNYLWDALLYLAIIVMMVSISLAFSLRMFTQTSLWMWLVILVGWGNAQIAMSFLLSTLFNKARTATIVSYLLVIGGVIFSYVLNVTVFMSDASGWVYLLFLYAPFACYRAIYLIGLGCSFYNCPSWDDVYPGSEFFWIMLLLYVDVFIYLALAFYLDGVIPREFGVTKHPLWPIKDLIGWIKKKRSGKKTIQENKEDIESGDTPKDEYDHLISEDRDAFGTETLDRDVAIEKERIQNGQIPHDSPIIITNLRKVYKSKPGTPEKLAVRGMFLHVEKGECFGLLGPNGAGKTTTISMLTGLFPPTSGNALIAGYSILEDIDAIHQVMSVCPQFDTVWMDLTCRETLLFYARLKGISRKHEKEHTKSILEQVGLSQYGNRKVRALSGGMRRRLSIGISLVGDPQVVFLDEPTTGLDPETRRHLWEVLLQVKKGRCMILTTHSMEEADILCSRIGIMSKGQLQCLGTQLHLKNKFGEGYTIHVTYDPANQERVHQYLESLLPSANLSETFSGNSIFQISRQDLIVSELFETMEQNKRQHGIQDWGISQTTLEDVFLSIARRDESEDLSGSK